MNYLTIGYVTLSISLLVIILLGYSRSIKRFEESTQTTTRWWLFPGFLVVWSAYIYVLVKSEILLDFSLPPRFPLLVFVPLIIIYSIFYFRKRRNDYIKSIPFHWLIYIQSFRIFVEFLLLYTFYELVIPEQATFEGYNFDIAIGITALYVGYLTQKQRISRNLLIAWNVLGILMIIIVGIIIATSIYRPDLWGSVEPLVSRDFLKFPYFLVPGFLAPLGIFIHVVSLAHLYRAGEKEKVTSSL